MVMTFLGYRKQPEPEHEVQIDFAGSQEDEVEVVSVWMMEEQADEDADDRSIASARSAKSLFDNLTSSDEESEQEDMELGGMAFSSNISLWSGASSKPYAVNRGWTALQQIDQFLMSVETGLPKNPPRPDHPNPIQEEDEGNVDENSTTASSKSNEELNETMSLSSSDIPIHEKYQKRGAVLSAKEKYLKSKAKDRKVYQEIKSRKKRIFIFLALLLFLLIVCLSTVFAVKASKNEESTSNEESNGNNGSDTTTSPNQQPPAEDSTSSFQPPPTQGDNSIPIRQPDELLNDPVVDADDDYTNPVISVDPSLLDSSATNSLVATLRSSYKRNGLNSRPLEALAGNDTPQRKALSWLASRDNQQYNRETTQTIRFALAVFYYATNAVPNYLIEDPDSWQVVDGWLTSASHCSWYGIICNSQGGVESIDLPANFLSGKLPLELGLLGDTLLSIDITDNDVFMFESDYDVFLHLGNLEILAAGSNHFESIDGLPTQLASLVNLDMLELSYNILGGDLSANSALSSMPRLTLLELEFNYFSGSIPYYIGHMENLVYLYLRDNKLEGDLSFINAGGLTNLYTMWVETNKITGAIPAGIAGMTELRSLALSDNQMTGLIDALGTLPDLQRVWIHSNKFFGPIPKSLETLQQLEILELHNNNLFGKMPKGLCDVFAAETYAGKALTSDCNGLVECKAECCTQCY